jgi:hypothetical protein
LAPVAGRALAAVNLAVNLADKALDIERREGCSIRGGEKQISRAERGLERAWRGLTDAQRLLQEGGETRPRKVPGMEALEVAGRVGEGLRPRLGRLAHGCVCFHPEIKVAALDKTVGVVGDPDAVDHVHALLRPSVGEDDTSQLRDCG